MDIKRFIAYYIKVVIDGDLKKMLIIAQQSQEADARDKHATLMHTPTLSIVTTTMSPHSADWFYQFKSDRARCAVPIAMTLFSVIDVMGNLLKPTINEDNRQSIEHFFDYAYGHSITTRRLTTEESGVLNGVYRNGCMHGFFPSGMNIALNLDDSEPKPLKVDEPSRLLTLNVNYLKDVVIHTINKLFADESQHTSMQQNLDNWITKTYFSGKTKDRLDEFWSNKPY